MRLHALYHLKTAVARILIQLLAFVSQSYHITVNICTATQMASLFRFSGGREGGGTCILQKKTRKGANAKEQDFDKFVFP